MVDGGIDSHRHKTSVVDKRHIKQSMTQTEGKVQNVPETKWSKAGLANHADKDTWAKHVTENVKGHLLREGIAFEKSWGEMDKYMNTASNFTQHWIAERLQRPRINSGAFWQHN